MTGSYTFTPGRDAGLYRTTGPCTVRFIADNKVIWEQAWSAGKEFIIGARARMHPPESLEMSWATPGVTPPVELQDPHRASPGNYIAAMTAVDLFAYLDAQGMEDELDDLKVVLEAVRERILKSGGLPELTSKTMTADDPLFH